MLTMEKLNNFGADTKSGLARCVNNEAFYIRLVGMALNDGNFAKLEEAVGNGDLQGGFQAAHALKGVLSNLSLTPIQNPVAEITEHLRAETKMDYQPLLEEISARRAELLALSEAD